MSDRLGPVRYRSADPVKLATFYRQVLGFTLRSQTPHQTSLGTAERELLLIDHAPSARKVEKTTGLYHTAFLVPTHRDLVHLLGRIAESQTPVEGFNHHGTHEAIYLPDPDGNGIELAWDLPEDNWPRKADGQVNFLSHEHSFDPEAVLAEYQADKLPWDGLPSGTRVGHVHLHMANLAATKAFYAELLGLDVIMEWERNGMLFLSSDGYHHHVGNNLWKGKDLPAAPEDAVGLVEYTWRAPAASLPALRRRLEAQGHACHERESGFAVKDASGIGIAIEAF